MTVGSPSQKRHVLLYTYYIVLHQQQYNCVNQLHTIYLLLLYDLDLLPSTSPLNVPCMEQYLALVKNIFHISVSYHSRIKYLVAISLATNKNKNNCLNILSNLTVILLIYIMNWITFSCTTSFLPSYYPKGCFSFVKPYSISALLLSPVHVFHKVKCLISILSL